MFCMFLQQLIQISTLIIHHDDLFYFYFLPDTLIVIKLDMSYAANLQNQTSIYLQQSSK